MASEKISQLTPHTPNSSDVIPVELGGTNFSDTVGGIETAAAALVHWSTLLGDLAETQVIPFDGGTPGTADTGISRLGAASLAIGNGTAGDASGKLSCTYILNGGFSQYIQGDASGSGWQLGYYQSGLGLGPNAPVYWGSSNSLTSDTGISRLGAGSLAIGNGTLGNTSGTLNLKEIVLTDFGSTPTSSSGGGTAGTVGEIVQHSGALYFCSVTGVAGSATWNVITMTPSA